MSHIRRIVLFSLLAMAVVGCGEGRAIVVVDILSFIQDQILGDTLPYVIPASSSGSADRPAVSALLFPNASNSIVDSAQLNVGVSILNYSGGPGAVSVITFFGSDSATVYTSPKMTDTVSGSVTGADTVLLGHGFRTIVSSDSTFFTSQKVWIGIRAAVTNSGSQMTGRLELGALQLRVFLKDKFFK